MNIKNLFLIENIIGEGNCMSMSHPSGDYNEDTLKILSDLNIKIGFRSNLKVPFINSNLEIPREDHSNIMNKLKNMKITIFTSNQP